MDDLADLVLRRGQGARTYHGSVCEADDETILGSCVFILGLSDESLSGIVVRLPLSTITHTQISSIALRIVPFLRPKQKPKNEKEKFCFSFGFFFCLFGGEGVEIFYFLGKEYLRRRYFV